MCFIGEGERWKPSSPPTTDTLVGRLIRGKRTATSTGKRGGPGGGRNEPAKADTQLMWFTSGNKKPQDETV